MEKDLAVYVMVRNDLPSMNPGKAMAQVHHAGVQLMFRYQKDKTVQEYIEQGSRGFADGFNTTLVLSGTLRQIETAVNYIDIAFNVPCGIVKDPSYPFFVDPELAPFVEKDSQVKKIGPAGNKILFVRPEITCGWILIDRNNPAMRSLVDTMPLHA